MGVHVVVVSFLRLKHEQHVHVHRYKACCVSMQCMLGALVVGTMQSCQLIETVDIRCTIVEQETELYSTMYNT